MTLSEKLAEFERQKREGARCGACGAVPAAFHKATCSQAVFVNCAMCGGRGCFRCEKEKAGEPAG